MMFRRLSVLLLYGLLLAIPASAQFLGINEVHPLITLLAYVPDNEITRADIIGYVDYTLVETSRYAVVAPASYAEWEALDEDAQRLWREANRRIGTVPRLDAFSFFGEMPQTVGFDFFDIDRALTFGRLPAAGMLLEGAFDPAVIQAALEARAYVAEPAEQGVYLAFSEDPEGYEVNVTQVERGNFFDPALGRRPPVFISGQVVGSAFGATLSRSVFNAPVSSTPTLADAPDIGTLAAAVTNTEALPGALVQAVFFNLRDVLNLLPTSGDADADALEAFIAENNLDAATADLLRQMTFEGSVSEWDYYGPLPLYLGAAFADKHDGETQINAIALLYASEADAQTAAAELTRRLTIFSDEIVRRATTPLIDGVPGAAMLEPRVIADAHTGLYVAIVGVTYPQQQPEGVPLSVTDSGSLAPGIVFRWWMGAIFQRSFYPLWVTVE